MIEAIADLFVERVPRAALRPKLIPAASLLVVDACGRPRRVADLTRAVETAAPIRASYVDFDSVGEVAEGSHFDRVWMFVDPESDLTYCELYMNELAARFRGARVELVGVGAVSAEPCAVVLDESASGSAPPWRRTREISRGAAVLVERLLS